MIIGRQDTRVFFVFVFSIRNTKQISSTIPVGKEIRYCRLLVQAPSLTPSPINVVSVHWILSKNVLTWRKTKAVKATACGPGSDKWSFSVTFFVSTTIAQRFSFGIFKISGFYGNSTIFRPLYLATWKTTCITQAPKDRWERLLTLLFTL